VHCGTNDSFKGDLSQNDNINLDVMVEENLTAVQNIKMFYKKEQSISRKIINKFKFIYSNENINS
jgi:hypothetical protein